MTACQMNVKCDERLSILMPCGRPDATLVRVACSRMNHVELVIMCRRCMNALTYCQACFDDDRMLVRASKIILTPV